MRELSDDGNLSSCSHRRHGCVNGDCNNVPSHETSTTNEVIVETLAVGSVDTSDAAAGTVTEVKILSQKIIRNEFVSCQLKTFHCEAR
jgi:hypothetical protein